jgi:hypothetical protein
LISLMTGIVIKRFGRVSDVIISRIMFTIDQKSWFTSLPDRVLKQWNYGDNTLFRDHGVIAGHFIGSLCL